MLDLTFHTLNTDYDIRSFGQLLRLIRDSRGLSPDDLAKSLPIATSTISRIETDGIHQSDSVSVIVSALQQTHIGELLVVDPLKQEEADKLLSLYTESRSGAEFHKVQQELADIDFSFFHSSKDEHRSTIKETIEFLRTSPYPTFIADRLWYIHVFNRAVMNFFITPAFEENDEVGPYDYLKEWSAWHLIAGKLPASSPVRKVYKNFDSFFPQTIRRFASDIYPYILTPGIRCLIAALTELGLNNNFRFHQAWRSEVVFKSPFMSKTFDRRFVYKGRELEADVQEQIPVKNLLSIEEKKKLGEDVLRDFDHYWIGVWKPTGLRPEAAEDVFESVSRNPFGQELYYAADFDTNANFHVNTWPVLRSSIEALEK